MRRTLWGLTFVGLLVLHRPPAEAILGVGDAVFDVAVHFESVITAAESAATTANTATIIRNQVLDLTSEASAFVDPNGAGEVLGLLVNIACSPFPTLSLSFRIGSICAEFARLFPMRSQLPRTSTGYRLWQQEKHEQIRFSAATAARTQSFVESLGRDSQLLAGLLNRILGLIGNLQGLQVQQQLSAQQNILEMRGQLIHASFQRAMTLKLADEATAAESLDLINETVLGDWGLGDNGQ